MKKYLLIFFISMVPLIELRGAIPIALGMDIPAMEAILVCVLGNILPVPFIYLFARKVLLWGAKRRFIGRFCNFFVLRQPFCLFAFLFLGDGLDHCLLYNVMNICI